MDQFLYNNWRNDLTAWLHERQTPGLTSQSRHAAARPVLEVLSQARQIAAGISATAGGVVVMDHNKYENLAAILDQILAMDSFSLAEYTYDLPHDKHPGLRLWYESVGSLVTVVLFEDVRQWRVDDAGQKISWQALHLDLSGGQPAPALPKGAESFFAASQGWRGALTDAMCLPVRLFHQT